MVRTGPGREERFSMNMSRHDRERDQIAADWLNLRSFVCAGCGDEKRFPSEATVVTETAYGGGRIVCGIGDSSRKDGGRVRSAGQQRRYAELTWGDTMRLQPYCKEHPTFRVSVPPKLQIPGQANPPFRPCPTIGQSKIGALATVTLPVQCKPGTMACWARDCR